MSQRTAEFTLDDIEAQLAVLERELALKDMSGESRQRMDASLARFRQLLEDAKKARENEGSSPHG